MVEVTLAAAGLVGCDGKGPRPAPPPSGSLGRFVRVELPFDVPARSPMDVNDATLVNVHFLPPGGARPPQLSIDGMTLSFSAGLCAWSEGALRCETSQEDYLASADFDGDGIPERLTAAGALEWGNGAPATNLVSEGILAAAVDPPWVAAIAREVCSETIHIAHWNGQSFDPQTVAMGPFNLRGIQLGSLLQKETAIIVGVGCTGDHSADSIVSVQLGERSMLADVFGDPLRAGHSGMEAPMGVSIADFTGDGKNDAMVPLDPEVGFFVDSGAAHLEQPSTYPWLEEPDQIGWGTVALDIDGDGRMDACMANGNDAGRWASGHPPMWPVCFWNAGAGRFVNVAVDLGLDAITGQWHGLETGDIDGDGHLDLFVGSQGGPPAILLWRKSR